MNECECLQGVLEDRYGGGWGSFVIFFRSVIVHLCDELWRALLSCLI